MYLSENACTSGAAKYEILTIFAQLIEKKEEICALFVLLL